LHGKPSLEAYFSLIKSFVTANGHYNEFSNSSMIAEEQAKAEEVEGEVARQNKQGSQQLQETQNNHDNDNTI
jgi:hypothetical protein